MEAVNFKTMRVRSETCSREYQERALMLIAFLVPLKLSLTYIALVPSLLVWLIGTNSQESIKKVFNNKFVFPLIAFILVAMLLSGFGLRPLVSIQNLFQLFFFVLTIPFFVSGLTKGEPLKILIALLLGQTLASFHSLLQSAFPQTFSRLFIGMVSESGQLALMVPITLAVAITIYREALRNQDNQQDVVPSMQDGLASLGYTFLFGAFGFSNYFSAPNLFKIILAIATGALLLNAVFSLLKETFNNNFNSQKVYQTVLQVILPVLLVALLVNLKRGPWLGVTVGLTIFIILYYRKIFLPLAIAGIIAAVAVTPIRERITQSSQHFFISGGRSTIWSVGLDMTLQYPLGIGFDNSDFLRNFAPEVPPELVHFHNNFLNILVETGWIGFFLYLWWLACLMFICFFQRHSSYSSPMVRGIGCALLAWQVAGLVEYNFGDSEVLLVALISLALLVVYSEREHVSN